MKLSPKSGGKTILRPRKLMGSVACVCISQNRKRSPKVRKRTMQVRNAVCRKKGKNTKEGRVTEKKNLQSSKSRRVSTCILIYICRSINVYLEIKRPSVCLRIREMSKTEA